MDPSLFEKRFHRPEFLVLRTALLPFETFSSWGEGSESAQCADDPEKLESAFVADRQRLRERLNAIASLPEVREAFYVASPEFHRSLEQWRTNPDSKKGRRAERTLIRYFARMCGRSTPFGLFAGHALVMPGDRTNLRMDACRSNRRHVRLDMDYLGSLVETLVRDPSLQDELRFRPNSSIHRRGGQLRYAESRVTEKGRSYHFVAAGETDYLLETLQRAQRGATIAQLAEALVGEEVSIDEATAYVRELVATQLLVPELSPKATGPEPVYELISQLRPHASMATVVARLEDVRQALETMEQEPPGVDVSRYQDLADRLSNLPVKVDIAKLFQIDLLKRAEGATIGSEVLEEIARAVLLVHGLRPEPQNDELSNFKEAFRERYENREVPLLEVLDEESGIGFGSTGGAEVTPLLDGLGLPQRIEKRKRRDEVPRWTPFSTFLLDKLNERSADDLVLRLAPEELERFKTATPVPLPDAFHVTGKVAARSQEALDAGEFEVALHGASGPSGATMFGRFCHGDPDLHESVKQHLAAEEALRPEAIFAEVVHLPEGRVGNVILRPALRRYEIPFLGGAAVGDEFQLLVSDLMVSIRGQLVVLRSRRLGRDVLPRLTSAHNFNRSALNVYRFLCMLQYQESTKILGWSWGQFAGVRFLPRVVVGRIVVSPAEWRAERSEIADAIEAQDASRFAAVQRWRGTRRLPRYVLVADGDNKLPIDLDNVLSVDTLVELVKGRREFRLEELYPEPSALAVSGPEGAFVHELVVPFVVRREPTVTPRGSTEDAPSIRRTFAPGSEWLYAKIYAGTGSVDDLLREVIAPLVRQLRSDGSIDRWFFIRYGDPEWHLRVRFHGDPLRLTHEVLPRLETACARYVEAGLVWRIQFDTYEREIERYGGGEDMLLAEQLFQYDSDATLEILDAYSGDEFADVRWRLATRGVDQLLDDLGFDLERKAQIIGTNRKALFEELRATPSVEFQLGDRFRKERASLQALLDRANDQASPFADGVAALNRRSERMRPVTTALREWSSHRMPLWLESLAGSYIHMHANRVLRSAHRSQELVMYDFLARIYKSQRARLADRS